jgi:3-methyladenine DNA glycosylase AlkD
VFSLRQAAFRLLKEPHFDEALRISEILLGDKEELNRKAVGWTFRGQGKGTLWTRRHF